MDFLVTENRMRGGCYKNSNSYMYYHYNNKLMLMAVIKQSEKYCYWKNMFEPQCPHVISAGFTQYAFDIEKFVISKISSPKLNKTFL